MTHPLRFTALALAALLTACGGGDPDPIDRYVGIWAGCAAEGSGSAREVLGITRTTATSGSYAFDRTLYALPGCAGAGTPDVAVNGALTLTGTKTVAGEVVDKATLGSAAGVQKQVFVVRADGRLYSGVPTYVPGARVDAEGYPETMDTTRPLTLQR